jgi:hypothetical protein
MPNSWLIERESKSENVDLPVLGAPVTQKIIFTKL